MDLCGKPDGNVQDHNELIEILKNNKSKNILVIDDINDSGTTLKWNKYNN